MNELEKELKGIAQKLTEYKHKEQELDQAFFLKRIFSLPRLRKRMQLMDQVFEEKLRKWLMQENEQFRKLAEENLKLLEREEIKYKTKSARYSPVGTYSAVFEGKIHPDGYSHLQLTRANVGVYPMAKYDYVSKYIGHVDYFGNIHLKPVKIASALMYTRPRLYRGYVNDKGTIVLNVVKRDLEMLSGHVVIAGMIGLHFTDEGKREKFFNNRKKLIEIYQQARERFFNQEQTN